MQLEVGQRTQAVDLAVALEGNEGTFICQQGGQTFIAVSKRGHSITSLRPTGRRFIEVIPATAGQEGWLVEKLSNQEITYDESARPGSK